jgi:hypothetical protein
VGQAPGEHHNYLNELYVERNLGVVKADGTEARRLLVCR